MKIARTFIRIMWKMVIGLCFHSAAGTLRNPLSRGLVLIFFGVRHSENWGIMEFNAH